MVKYTDFDFGIIKSCLARPELYKPIKPVLDEIYQDWPVYVSMTECVGSSGKSEDMSHDIFYHALSSRLPDAHGIISRVNAQQPDHDTLINRVRMIQNRRMNDLILDGLMNAFNVLKSESRPLEDRWSVVKDFCVKTMSKFHCDDSIESASDYADILLDTVRNRSDGHLTGYHYLDSVIRGFSSSEFVIIAGAPSMGKTSFGINCAVNMAVAGKKVLFFTIEMAPSELMERILCILSKVDIHTIRSGKCTIQQNGRIAGAIETIRRMDLKIIGKGRLTPSDVNSYIETTYHNCKPDVVFVDYLQLMTDDAKSKDEYQKTTNISKALKQIAMETKVPIVAIAQLNRGVTDTNRSHRPKMSDLRGSGSLEQDANKIILLHRDDYYKRRESPNAQMDGSALVIIDKHRQGECTDILFTWIPEYFLFKEEGRYDHKRTDTGKKNI